MGWAAFFGRLDWAPVLLYLGGILWTIGYDTIYAHQDKEDDALIGVRSTALLFGARTRPYLALFYAGATVLFAGAFVAAGVGVAGLMPASAAGALQLAWQVARLDIDDPDGLPAHVPLQPRLWAGSCSPGSWRTAWLARSELLARFAVAGPKRGGASLVRLAV